MSKEKIEDLRRYDVANCKIRYSKARSMPLPRIRSAVAYALAKEPGLPSAARQPGESRVELSKTMKKENRS
jgi:hypothetical protein